MVEKEEKDYSDKFNIMVIGDEKVGKTTILKRYFDRTFNLERKKTIGVDFHYKDWTYKENKLTYNIKFWDTAGQEKFKTVGKSYFQRANGMIVVMSIDNRSSFDSIKMWINSVCEKSEKIIPIIIICNKIDLEDNKEVEYDEVKSLGAELSINVFFTSAKSGDNIDEVFEFIMNEVIKINTIETKRVSITLSKDRKKYVSCCKY